MSRLKTPATIADTPAAAQPLLTAVKAKIGAVPNLFRVIANSPAALEGYLGLSGALAKGSLPAATGERLALAVAEANGCGYCLAAHSYLAKAVAGLDEAEILANRRGRSGDAKADAAVAFALKVIETRGHVGEAEVLTLRQAGYEDGEIVEIVLHVALNTLTNFVNSVAGTAVDFPAAPALAA